LLVAVVLVVVAATAHADVVLHPGYVTGNSGLTNWTFSSGSVSISSPSGFSGSTTVSGTAGATYTLAIEGAQTYTGLGQSFSTSNGYVSVSRQVNLPVAIGATVANQNLLTPGGTIQVNLSATTDPGATATVSAFYLYANAANAAGETATEFYSAAAYYGPQPPTLPMAATSNISVGAYYVYFLLTDASGNTCSVYEPSFPPATVASLAEGATAVVNQSFDLTGKVCPPPVTGAGTIEGVITLNQVPAGLSPTTAQVYVSGPTSSSADISGAFTLAAPPLPYSFSNLPVGTYYMSAYAYFGSGASATSYVTLPPDGGQNYVYLQNGDDLKRNFTYDIAKVQGDLSITGPLATLLSQAASTSYASAFSYLYPDPGAPGDPNYGSNAGVGFYAYSGQPLPPIPAPYVLALPAGSWNARSFSAQAYSNTDALYLSVYDPNATPFTVAGGSTLTQDIVVDTSQGDLVFDVAQPGINVSYPNAYINAYDAATGRYVYISAQSYALNKTAATVRVIGPPGQYPFTASARVGADCSGSAIGCSYATFPPGTVTLGQATNTPVGTNETVTLLDQNGSSIGVQLTFDNVTSAGQTNGAYTNQGPVPPGGFTLMPAFSGANYLSISTTATFTGNVLIAISYNPQALGLTPQTESLLQLWHYKCDSSGSNCQWEFINGGHTPDPDTVNHVIYGVTSSFSVFALLLPPVTSTTPPVTTIGLSGTPGANGWYVSNVMVTLSATSSGGSAVATTQYSLDGGTAWTTYTAPFTISREGTTTILAYSTDTFGNKEKPATSQTVKIDKTGPTLAGLPAAGCTLWPPDHRMVQIATVTATDGASGISDGSFKVTVTSNEAVNMVGSGKTSPDIVVNGGAVQVRAERSGTGSGRIYTLTATATDQAGNQTTASATCTVPHDHR